MGNAGGVASTGIASHGQKQSLQLILPPLAVVLFSFEKPQEESIPVASSDGQKEEADCV
jgi:hypothetical protein